MIIEAIRDNREQIAVWRLAAIIRRCLVERTNSIRSASSLDHRSDRRLAYLSLRACSNGPPSWEKIDLNLIGGVTLSLRNVARDLAEASPQGINVDHVAIAVFAERFQYYVDAITDRIPNAKLEMHRVTSSTSTMHLGEIRDSSSDLRIVLCKSIGKSGHIDKFLVSNDGEGIQHVAFAVESIVTAVKRFNANQIRFVGQLNESSVEEAIVAFTKRGRTLRQAFTCPLIGSTFIELISRDGIQSFAPKNISKLLRLESTNHC